MISLANTFLSDYSWVVVVVMSYHNSLLLAVLTNAPH